MPQYRKKPVVIEAIKITRDQIIEDLPKWIRDALLSDVMSESPNAGWYIKTLEGVMRADRGDWIIRGVRGEIYPCKPEIFAATYEPA